jgi:tetratricopeptide (TPR) repeat protein
MSMKDQFAPVITALLSGVIGGVLVALIQGSSNLHLEKAKLESGLILSAVETGDEKQAISNLSFLLEAGLISDDEGRIAALIPSETSPSLVLPSGSVSKAVDLARQGNFAAAIQEYQAAALKHPEDAEIQNLLGYALLRNGEAEQAVRHLRAATALDPDYIWGHYNLSLGLWAAHDPSGALDALEKVLQLDSRFDPMIREDTQFEAFRAEPRFLELLAEPEREDDS